jgi:predicted nucleic acid-binding protein
MPEIVFGDTAAFIALGNTRDDLHQTAIKVSQQLAQAQAHVLTTDAVLIEVTNAFSKVILRPIAWQLIEAVQALVALRQAVENGGLQQESLNVFRLALEYLLDQVIYDIGMTASKRPDETGEVIAALHRQCCQL